MLETASECKLGLSQDADRAGDLADSKSRSAGMLCIFADQALGPISWACRKTDSSVHTERPPLESDEEMSFIRAS